MAFFTTAAIAIASRRANAVGAVRLGCAPEGLEIELLRVGSFTAGFAPGGVVEAVRFRVPYTAVRGLVREGRTLCLALDPAVATPYNRFALVRFSDDPSEALVGAYRARARARLASLVMPVPLGLLAAVLAPRGLVSGWLGLAAVGAVAALSTWALLREAVAWLSWGGPVSDRYRDALEAELSRRLGLAPARVAIDAYGARPLEADAPRPRLGAAIAIGALALAVVGAIAFLKRYAGEPPAASTRDGAGEPLRAGIAAAARRAASADLTPPAPTLPRCLCDRAASPLWERPVPVLSVLYASRRDGGATDDISPRPDKNGKMRYDFDLSVVNNGAAPLFDVKVVVTFARRSPEGNRVGIKERGLFWEGELAPGAAVKWRVRAPGTEMRVDTDALGDLPADGSGVAPADAFFALTSARRGVVRAHAAMMLAYLRDPRALEAAQRLDGAGAALERLRARVQRASQPLVACAIRADEASGEATACVFNAQSAPVEGFTLSEVPDEEAESPPAPRSWPVDARVPVHEGVVVPLPVEPGGKIPPELLVRGR